jgi:hypothetical protein
MIRLGLCSGACILRDVAGVIKAARAARLEALEWSADAHIAAGDLRAAGEAMMATLTAGLTVASYATAYRVGSEDPGLERLASILDTAAALYAPIVRIYAADLVRDGSGIRPAFVEALQRAGELAAARGITLCLSMGRGTGFAGYGPALEALRLAQRPFLRLAWEDLPGYSPGAATGALAEAGSLAGLVVARCAGRDGSSRPASADREAWLERLRSFRESEDDHKMGSFALLGAPREEGPAGEESLAADADTLRGLRAEVEPGRADGKRA